MDAREDSKMLDIGLEALDRITDADDIRVIIKLYTHGDTLSAKNFVDMGCIGKGIRTRRTQQFCRKSIMGKKDKICYTHFR